MRGLGAVLLVIVGALAGVPAGAQAAGSLLGQWPLDGAYEDGANAATADVSGNGLHLKGPAGSIHLGPPALFGTGATLNANKTPMKVTSPLLAPAKLSLLVWIKQTGNPGTLRYIAGRGDDGFTCLGSTYALYSGYPASGGNPAMPGLRFYVRYGAAGVSSALTDAPLDASVFDGRWHLIAGTYDGAAARLYVDGVLVGTPKPAPGPLAYTLGGGTSFYVDGYAEPGCSGADNDDWPSPIDEVRLYDRALSPSELTRLAASTGPASPELITDESLIQPIPVPAVPAPAPVPGPVAEAKASQKVAAAVPAKTTEQAAASLAGASKAPPAPELGAALVAAQAQVAEALRSAAAKSQVSAIQEFKEVSAKDAKKLKPSEEIQNRLDAMKYGMSVQVPAGAPGEIIETIASVMLLKKQKGQLVTQTITLQPAIAIAGMSGTSGPSTPQEVNAQVQVPVDKQATAAMAKDDVVKAAIGVQAAKLDSMSDLSQDQQLKMQQYQDVYTKTMEQISNVVKKIQQTQDAITQNMKGGETKSEQKENKDLRAKAEKLDKDIRKIEAARDEAAARSAVAMQASTKGLVDGLVQGIVQAAGAVGGSGTGAGKGIADATNTVIVSTGEFIKALPASTTAVKGCGENCKLAIKEAASK